MFSRRTFFRGAAGSVTALIGAAPLISRATPPDADSASTNDHPKPHLAIFDHRFAAGRKFASSSAARGIATRPVANDVTALWFSELHPLWKDRPVAIAGLTTYGPLFCLERLAWDHGMRVLRREQHDVRVVATGEPNQLLYSWIIAPRQKPSSNRECLG